MKKKLIILLCCLIVMYAQLQGQKNNVELKLAILQNFKDSSVNNLQLKGVYLQVSLKNNCSYDVYIPHFNLYARKQSIHVYKFNDKEKIYEETYFEPGGWAVLKDEKGRIYDSDPYFDLASNDFYKQLVTQKNLASKQLNERVNAIPKLPERINELPNNFAYLFLKANEEIKIIDIWNFSRFMGQNADLKILYGYDSASLYKDVKNGNEKFPTFINGYKFYPDNNVLSNTVYLNFANENY